MDNVKEPFVFPFGKPVLPRKPSASSARKFFILGAYPSALHVKWTPPSPHRPIQAIAVDNEPEPFWCGENEVKLIEDWKKALGWKDAWGTAEPVGKLNGSSGVWVKKKVIEPLCKDRSSVWITDCLDTYRCSKDLAVRIEDTYSPFAKSNSLTPAKLLTHPDEGKIVAEAQAKQLERLKKELACAQPELIITLGNAALRVFRQLIKLTAGDPGEKLSPSTDAYGRKFKVQIDSCVAEWLPLAHPAAPKVYQGAHNTWLKQRSKCE